MTWDPSKHARVGKGASGGGEFTSSGSSSSGPGGASSSPRRRAAAHRAGRTVPKGSLGFDGRTGTGYGSKNGDARVRRLQQALNRLGIKDAHGKPLAVDGRLGPKTTAAIERWQKAHGQKPTGMVDAATLRQLGGRGHSGHSTHHTRARAASRAKSHH